MDTILEYLSSHPAILTMLVIFAVIIILYFIFKQMFKLWLILLLIVLAAGGYYYLKNPGKMSKNIKQPIEAMKSGADDVMEKSKSLYKDSKNLIDKATDVPGDINKLIKGDEDKKGK